MPADAIIYFDIAAVVIMAVSLASLFLRNLTHGAANRMYMSAMILVTLTALAAVGCEACDAMIDPSFAKYVPLDTKVPHAVREAMAVAYYALLSLTAPAYLVLIATVSDTSHRLNKGNVVRFFLWVPMILVFLLVITNSAHHLIFSYDSDFNRKGPLFFVLYIEAIYYSVLGIIWLIRWRPLLSANEFSTLILLYPIMLATLIIQYHVPGLRLEMFVTSISMMLVSAFVIHPETRLDTLVNAASLQAYDEMCSRAFITDKPLCLVYVEIVNMERLRQLVGKLELQGIIRDITENLRATLNSDDVLYYLHNGLFCISSRNLDPIRAERIARKAHEEGKAKSIAMNEKSSPTEMRSCVVRIPEDIPNREMLKSFGRRFAHLVPHSTVTTLQALSKRDDFKLQMALSSIIAKAIEERSFEVHYQPIYCLHDGRFHSAEALVRLNDPELGWIPPALFITEAEQSGTILRIGSILLEKICAFLGKIDFEATGLDYVEANLSIEQCIRAEITDEVLELLERNKVEPSRLNLEITETSASFSREAIEENVRKFAEAGVAISIDDFGTGYSNIERMLSLPFSLVKIDKAFVDTLDDEATHTVLASIVSTIKSIGKDVLVEGAETSKQVDELAAMGVDYIQGYYFAKPMPQDEFVAFLIERNNS